MSPDLSTPAPVFFIVISEKGGAERRESFTQDQVTVGRVQGNDLMLPKGNVSKRHCRLEHKNGRFIVTDQESTNGTYVNRRRITQSTVVREGDRIYVGDFVLRIETEVDSDDELMIESAVSEDVPDRSPPSSSPNPEPTSQANAAGPSSGRPQVSRSNPPARSASPPALAGTASVRGNPASKSPDAQPEPRATQAELPPSRDSISDRTRRESEADTELARLFAAVSALVHRVSGAIEPRVLDRDFDAGMHKRIERMVEDAYNELVIEGELPTGADEQQTKTAAVFELAQLGPLERLITDASVQEIAVSGPGHIAVFRGGFPQTGELPFCSAASLPRALSRLCRRAEVGIPDELRSANLSLAKLGFDLELLGNDVLPTSVAFRLTRREQVMRSLEDLVRSGVISRSMATFLRHCVAAQTNVLVVGPARSGASEVLSALATAADGDRILGFASEESPRSGYDGVVWLEAKPKELANALRTATRFVGHRVLLDGLGGSRAEAMMSAIAEGAQGLLARIRARSIERGIERLCTDLALQKPGVTPFVVADAFVGAFDLVVEVARLPDGRSRVIRIAELERGKTALVRGTNVFEFEVERTATGGAVEGTFRATGHSPQIAADLRHHGRLIDLALFSRQPTPEER